ncbi:aldehyde ferredoxin oxidoreductase [Nanoarchaeota archaeon NZ13-N]|nr:MAG: aldehyde ferredoxin oxidoreductase [Nanoarchaeota archaeon NZ13-N]
MFGYSGKILRINLSSREIREEKLEEEVAKNWLGGRGLGVYYFLKEVDPKVDPLSEENKIIFLTGPLTGIQGAPTPGRAIVISKSPLNNRLSWSSSGGKLGPYLKFAGYDAIVIEGKSNEPVYLLVSDKGVEIRDAREIWGKNVFEAYEYLYNKIKEEFHIKDLSIVCIGPAGENLVKYSSILVEKYHAFGRMGFGAILGYKKLKAIVVFGDKKPEIYDEESFRRNMAEIIKKLRSSDIINDLSKYGTLGMLITRVHTHNAIPSYNFTGYIKINPDEIRREFERRIDEKESFKEYCWGCQIGCHKYVRSLNEKIHYEGGNPEFWGGFVSLGSSLGITDIDFIIYLKGLCDKYGLDAISTGHTISNFIEICEKKNIYDIKFGERDKIIDLIEKIAYRRDIGNELAEGADYIGKKYNYPVTTSKGLEIGLCHPDKAYGYNLAITTSNRGDHNQTMLRDEILLNKLDPLRKEGKIDYVIHMQNLFAVIDSLGICIFSSYALEFEDLSRILKDVTGFEINLNEVGERVYNAERYYNYLSLGYEEDKLPERFKLDNKDLLEEYYRKRGWINGVPKGDRLKELKIIQ